MFGNPETYDINALKFSSGSSRYPAYRRVEKGDEILGTRPGQGCQEQVAPPFQCESISSTTKGSKKAS